MLLVRQPPFYRNKDRGDLTDEKDNTIAVRLETEVKSYYQVKGMESEAYGKVCAEVTSYKVCVSWDGAQKCELWGDVDVCSKLTLVPKGFSNIS
jgi:hypothetical protein